MEPLCWMCQNPATSVCIHPECKQPSFFCLGPCIRKAAAKIHSHGGQPKIISLSQFQDEIKLIKNTINFDIFYAKHFQKIEQKADVIRCSINRIIKQMVEKHKNDLKQEIPIQLSLDSKMLLDKISDHTKHAQLLGQEAKFLFEGSDINANFEATSVYANRMQSLRSIQFMKISFFDNLTSLEESIRGKYITFNKKQEISMQLYNKGVELKFYKKWTESIQSLTKAKQAVNFDYKILYQVGCCQYQLGRYRQAQQNFKLALEFQPKNQVLLNKLGIVYSNQKNSIKAIEYFSKAIEISRGDQYQKLGKTNEAIQDYLLAGQLQPPKQNSQQKEKIVKLLRNDIG